MYPSATKKPRTLDEEKSTKATPGLKFTDLQSNQRLTFGSKKPDEAYLSVENFFQARENEVIALQTLINKSSGGTGGGYGKNRRAFQLLPRHLRRRTMSHKPHMVPFRLRNLALKQASSKSIPTSITKYFYRRKRSRVRRVLKTTPKASYEALSSVDCTDKLWLETHIWHAKRFQMISHGSYKIPYHMFNRFGRSVYRASNEASLLFESSFIEPISIQGTRSNMEALLHCLNMIHHEVMPTLDDGGWLRQIKSYQQAIIYRQSVNNPKLWIAVAPVFFHGRRIGDEFQYFFWIDTIAYQEVFNLIQKQMQAINQLVENGDQRLLKIGTISAVDFRGKWNRFELIGPKASHILQMNLLPTDEENRLFLRRILGSRPSMTPNGLCLVLEVKDPRLVAQNRPVLSTCVQPKVSGHSSLSLSFKTGFKDKENLCKGIIENTTQDPSKIFEAIVLIDEISNNSCWKESGSQSAWSLSWFNSPASTCQFHDHEIQEYKRISASSSTGPGSSQKPVSSSTCIILSRIPSPIHGRQEEGWILHVPKTWGATFWKRLILTKGIRPIGYRERQVFKLHFNQLRFPEDYPGSAAYERHQIEQMKEMTATWLARPPSKRIHYQRLGIESPFKTPWMELADTMCDGDISITSKIPRQLFGTKTRPNPLQLVAVSLSFPKSPSKVTYNARVYCTLSEENHRQVLLGFVTSGGYSYAHGMTVAFAFCRADLLKKFVSDCKDSKPLLDSIVPTSEKFRNPSRSKGKRQQSQTTQDFNSIYQVLVGNTHSRLKHQAVMSLLYHVN